METSNLRIYGNPPFGVAVLHGGPGAPGYMAPVARTLAARHGVLEPLQTADSLEGQVQELHQVLLGHADLPVVLVGSSWGAMLGFIYAARYPTYVRKLILVGSGVFEPQYAAGITATRMARLSADDRRRIADLSRELEDPEPAQRDEALAQLGALFERVDAYDPLTLDTETLHVDYHIYQHVWADAEALRASGDLLALGKEIHCPVVAIHGDYDPHPPEGVRDPLAGVLADFRFILLPRCGHMPWIERHARERFYTLLEEEIGCNER